MDKTVLLFLSAALAGLMLCSAGSASAKGEQFQFRALWVDTASYQTPHAADKVIEQCKAAKINVIIASVLVHGGLMHKSTHFLHTVVATDDYDPLAYIIEKAHAAGIKVHAMYATYYEGVKGLTPAHPEWICTDIDGVRMDSAYFMSPQIPGVNDYLLSVIKDSLPYDIDGIQLDYIRYYGSSYDYSEAGRAPFIKTFGFDPANFLNNTEKIVSPSKDPFPVRVLHPKAHAGKPWEYTWIEGLMDRSGVGFGFITDTPANVDALRAPGVLVVNRLFDVSTEMADAISRYVKRGGSVIWIDCPALGKNQRLAELLGVKPATGYLSKQWLTLKVEGNHRLGKVVPSDEFNAAAEYAPEVEKGTIVARFSTGQPAIIVNTAGKGRTVLIAFNAGSTDSDGVASLMRGTIGWLRSESGVKADGNQLARRRADWLAWRSDKVMELVKGVHDALKAKNPNLTLSVAGGSTGVEYYSCLRNGRKWMQQGLLDFVCPMDYCDSTEDLRQLLAAHKQNVPKGRLSSIYPGLALYTGKTIDGKNTTVSQDPHVLQEQLTVLREEGYGGFALFCAGQLNDDQIKVLADAAK